MARRAWDSLTPAYRTRLERQGITRESHARGTTDLRVARGHRRDVKPTYAPANDALVLLAVKGQATEEQIKQLDRSYRTPKWIPKNFTPELKAALSYLPDPKTWASVEFTPYDDGQPWTMMVQRKNGYPVVIQIPGGGGPGTSARDVLDWLTEDLVGESAVWFDVVESP